MSLLLGRIRSLSPYKGGALLPRRCCCSTFRLPPIHRRPMGFAPPPHDGFALLASAHRCTCLAANTPYIGSQPQAILLGGCILHVDDALPYWLAPRSVSVVPALLPKGDEFRMYSWRNFVELRNHEVRRIHLPRTPVNWCRKEALWKVPRCRDPLLWPTGVRRWRLRHEQPTGARRRVYVFHAGPLGREHEQRPPFRTA